MVKICIGHRDKSVVIEVKILSCEEQLPGQLDVFDVIKHKEKVLKEIEDKALNGGIKLNINKESSIVVEGIRHRIKLVENKWEVF